MTALTEFDIPAFIDSNKIGNAQIALIVLCCMCLIIDGFDAQSIGYVAPSIIQDWNIPKANLGPVFGAGLLGMLFGALGFSLLADKLGRRPILIAATTFFAVCMFATAYAHSVTELLVLRFITGLGLGGVMPNALALAAENSPKRMRVTLMMIISCGFIIGGVVGGLGASTLIPAFGWRSVFVFGGIAPLIIAALIFIFLPESMQFLAVRGKRSAEIAKWLKRIDPTVNTDAQTQYIVHEHRKEGALVTLLFRDGRAAVTILIWVMNFANLVSLYFLANWLPTVVMGAGYSIPQSVLAGTVFWTGGLIGSLLIGIFIDKLVGFAPMLVGTFVLAGIATLLIGQPIVTSSLLPLFIVIFFAGFGANAGQAGLNSLSAIYYPTQIRSTGVGWGLGIGRVGSVVGPVLAGELIRQQWSSSELFIAAAIPAAVSTLAMLAIWRLGAMSRSRPEHETNAETKNTAILGT